MEERQAGCAGVATGKSGKLVVKIGKFEISQGEFVALSEGMFMTTHHPTMSWQRIQTLMKRVPKLVRFLLFLVVEASIRRTAVECCQAKKVNKAKRGQKISTTLDSNQAPGPRAGLLTPPLV